jgi:phosphoribosylformylglycinamidine cyclo-ligase
MNVNDVVAVGAHPIALVDYIAVQSMDQGLLSKIGKGLHEGAKISGISIVGGEIAQIREMLSPDPNSFDLVGTCIGTVRLDSIIDGSTIEENDLLLGIESSGLHSNGFTLARKALLGEKKYTIDTYVPDLGIPLGEELLKPTYIYVPYVLEMFSQGIAIKALAHITGGGLLNLTRINSDFGFEIEKIPEVPPIFSLIQDLGGISDEEMFRTFNMGIGFCLVTGHDDVTKVFDICQKNNINCFKLGYAVRDKQKRIIINDKGLTGKNERFERI